MKVLHLSSEMTWRGGEQQIAYLIEELQKKGVECIVACRKKSAFEKYCLESNITYHSLPFSKPFDLRSAIGIKRICVEDKIDIVHIHSSLSHTLAIISTYLGCKTPMILSRRVDFKIGSNWLSRFKYNHASIKKIICISHKINEIVSRTINNPEKCITIHSGIDLSRFNKTCDGGLRKKYNVPEHYTIIGNVSAIAPHKDYHTFVEVANLVVNQNPNIIFFIIGDGPQRAEIENLINEKNLNDKIIVTGFLKNIPQVLPCLNIFLITSKTEGLGTTILDAFAAGVPVVATAAGGIPEMVKNDVTGLLAETGNIEQLAKNVQHLIHDKEKQQHLIKNAKEFVNDFSKEQMALQNLNVYNQLLKGN